jgi:two-component system chemotaxis response regulator CheY
MSWVLDVGGQLPVKILIVEDSRAMRIIIQRTLRLAGIGVGASVLEASNGAEALAAIRSEKPDLVLSDWNMPQMSGIDLLEELQRSGHRPARFGFVTTESTQEMKQRALASGASFFITKPFTPASFAQALLPGQG